MSTEAFSLPRFGLPLTFPRPRVVTEWLSTADRENWSLPPSGDGQPVMLIPGFLAGDTSLTRMAVWLRTGGYELARSGIAWNTGCMEQTVQRLESRLEEAVQRAGRPALIVGQSRGGVWPSILTVGTLGTLGVPGMFALSCVRGDCCARTRDAIGAPFPEGPRFLSLYSRSDEVVHWRACLDPGAEALEVHTSHVGMGMAREVWDTLAAALK
jgi:triacylglycerol lipase